MLTVIVEIICYCEDKKDNTNLINGYKLLHLPILMFLLVWFIIGNIWWFGDGECEDFAHGYWLTLGLLALYYVLFAMIMGFLVVLGILYYTKRYGVLSQWKCKLMGQPYDVIE